jgi:hypothetical protein
VLAKAATVASHKPTYRSNEDDLSFLPTELSLSEVLLLLLLLLFRLDEDVSLRKCFLLCFFFFSCFFDVLSRFDFFFIECFKPSTATSSLRCGRSVPWRVLPNTLSPSSSSLSFTDFVAALFFHDEIQ